jgi:type VI secretion system protein ImpH
MATLNERLTKDYHKFDFFQAISLIEESLSVAGIRDAVGSGKIRFVPDPSLSFPPNDISGIRERDGMYLIMPSFMSLFGVTSPLPVYFSEYLVRRPEQASALYDFLTIFNNRFHTLFYKAWKKYHFIRSFTPDGSDQFTQHIGQLAGIPQATMSPEQLRLLAYCGILAGSRRGPAALKAMISSYFDGIPVSITEHFPRWAPIKDVKMLGIDSRLGINSLCGTSYYDVSGKFRVVVGPLKRELYETFLTNTQNIVTMKSLIQRYIAEPLLFDIEVQLQSMELVPVALGLNNARLGTTSSLGKSSSKTDIQSVVIE